MEIHPTHKGMGWRMCWSAGKKKKLVTGWSPADAAKQNPHCQVKVQIKKDMQFFYM